MIQALQGGLSIHDAATKVGLTLETAGQVPSATLKKSSTKTKDGCCDDEIDDNGLLRDFPWGHDWQRAAGHGLFDACSGDDRIARVCVGWALS